MEMKDLIKQIMTLGFDWTYSRDDDNTRWVTLYELPTPSMRYQFLDSAEGLKQLEEWIAERKGYSAKSKNKAGDTIYVSVDRGAKQYRVAYAGLVGYDAVEFHVGSEDEASALYAALLAVQEVEAD